MAKKIAIITSHPIQYNAPLFALMAKESEIDLVVFYTWGEAVLGPKYDPDFGKEIEWDIPLLDGYNYIFLKNISKDPGSHHFKGIINPTLNQEIDAWGPDVIWVWGWSFCSHLNAMRYFKGKVPVWFRGDSTLLDESKRFTYRKIVRRVLLTLVYKLVDKAFYVGTHNKFYFKAHGLKENQVVYAPHAIDNERFADPTGKYTEQANFWRLELGINKAATVLLFVGKLETKKNPFYFRQLIEKTVGDGIVGIMVGNGSLEEELKKNAPSNLIFLPFQNQSIMPIVYRLANVLILPSNGPSETWGLVINEALACGTMVYASDKCGGAIDLLPPNFIFSPSNFNQRFDLVPAFNVELFDDYQKKFTYEMIVNSVLENI
jgi:glycosyltransferase involved in cell wall biosynthesis